VGPSSAEEVVVNWLAFYREQGRLMWEWRASRLALVRRILLSYLAAMLALLIIVEISPDLKLDSPGSLLLAGLLLTVLNGLARPALLFILSPLPTIAVPIAGLILEVPIVIAVGSIVPGVEIKGLEAAVRDAVMLTVLNAIFSEILRASDDDSYHGTQVRALAKSVFGKRETKQPGLLMIQIDGLSLPVLENQMRAGRMPTLDRLVRHGESRVDPWVALLPPVTPVSQAGILHGNNDDMPGFRWFEKSTKNLLVANTPEGASEILHRRSDGHGLLAEDGASIGNLVTGDASRTFLTMATIAEDLPTAEDPSLRGIVVRQGQLPQAPGPHHRRDRQGALPAGTPAGPRRRTPDPPRPPLRPRAGPHQRLAAEHHDGARHRGDVPRRSIDLCRLHRLRRARPSRRPRTRGGGRRSRRARPDDRQHHQGGPRNASPLSAGRAVGPRAMPQRAVRTTVW